MTSLGDGDRGAVTGLDVGLGRDAGVVSGGGCLLVCFSLLVAHGPGLGESGLPFHLPLGVGALLAGDVVLFGGDLVLTDAIYFWRRNHGRPCGHETGADAAGDGGGKSCVRIHGGVPDERGSSWAGWRIIFGTMGTARLVRLVRLPSASRSGASIA